MTDFIQHTLLPLVEYFKSYAALVAFLAAFGETLIGLGFFIPGSTLLLFLGLLAGQGYIDIKTILLFGLFGAYLGDISNYYIGKRYGSTLFKKPWLHLSRDIQDSTLKFLNTYGAKSVFLARFLPGFKESVSFVAGSLKMDRFKFLGWDFLGALGWSFEFIGIGYLFSASLSLAQLWLTRTLSILFILLLSLLLLYLLKRFVIRNAPAAKSIVISLWNAFLHNQYVSKFFTSHPKLTKYIYGRFDHSRFSGLPLTVSFLAFVYILALFGGIVEDLLTKDPIIYADRIIANLMVQWRTPDLTLFFTWVTYLGKAEVVIGFLAAATLVLLLYKKFDELSALYLSFFGSVIFVYLSKLAFHRVRPETALYFEPTYSFPSGHAVISISFYGFLGYLLMRHAKSFKTKVDLFFITVVVALLIGLSRIYLGEHYLSDVYGGYLLGTLWVIAAISLIKWLSFKKYFPKSKPVAHAKIFGYIAIMASISFYAAFGTFYHYKSAIHPKNIKKEITDISNLFANENNYFTRNILGIKSEPISLIVAVNRNTDFCRRLSKHGWQNEKMKKNIDIPIFWHFKAPLCFLYKKDGTTIYLLKIWNAPYLYKGEKLFIVAADAIIGFKWDSIPIFTEDLESAKMFALKDLKEIFSMYETKTFEFGKPFIKERIFDEPYFSNGKVMFLK